MYKQFLFRQYNSCRIQQSFHKIIHILLIHSRSEGAAVKGVLRGAGSKAADAGLIIPDGAGLQYVADGKAFVPVRKRKMLKR